eukprot:jgi/Mesvir1/21830/Mv04215-RA.1
MSSVELEQKLKPKLHEAKKTGKLNLSYSELKELPQGLSSKIKITTNLVELDLRSNTLVALPDDIVELRMLRVVKLNYNKFTTVPHILINLPRLQVLEMSGNLLTEVPEHIVEMQALKELDLSGNQLSTLNPAITRLDHLTTLNLENNLLVQLPEDIGSMKSLARLDCNTNRLSVLPSSLGKCATLIKVDLRANSLSTVPPSMGHLPNLREFDLRYNLLKEPYKSKYEEGLAKFAEFLREEEERLRQEEIERLKPVGVEVGAFTEFKVKMEGKDCPTARIGHSIVHAGNATYVFGGLTDEGKVADLYVIDMDTMDWKRPKTTGTAPCARDGHCAAVDSINGRMFVFGGRNAEKKRLNDLHYLDLKTKEWAQPVCEGTWPTPRECATAVVTGTTLILFGGHGSGQRFNEVHFLDLEAWTWSQPVISGSAPAPRESCAGCMDGPLLFLHGGKNNFVLGDAYVLDTGKLRWGQLVTDGRVPPPRFGHQSYVARCTEYQRMYIFGGMDELGGQCFSMFYLDLAGATGAGAAPGVDFDEKLPRTWAEASTELSFNAHRTFVFHDHRIYIYQHHSPFLKDKEERDKTADTGSRGAPCWDVFKVASLADFGAVVSSADNGKPVNAKSARINHTVRTRNVPTSFYTTSAKEKAMLDHVEQFRKRFIELYPRRRPLLLCPPNECDVRKFLCTTVRPTKLGFKSLYDWRTCASFLADFLTYEPLEDPINYPSHIPSPWSVLQWQGGDSFDFAVALASLLIGVGYDALCVVGYAPLAVTSNDQSREECPLLVAEAERERAEEYARKNPPPAPKQTKYVTKEPPTMESAFLKFLADRKAADAAAKEAREAKEREAREAAAAIARGEVAPPALPQDKPPAEAEPADKLYGKRLHAWVLVLAGRREVTESFFIEPTTGLSYGVESSPYEGIEFVWNQRNLWVNMQARFLGPVGAAVNGAACNPPPPATPAPSDGSNGNAAGGGGESGMRRTHYLTGMSLNLWETHKWEAVLEDSEAGSYVGSSAGGGSASGSRGGGLADGALDDDDGDEGLAVAPVVPPIPKPGSALATTIRRGSSNAAAEALAADAAGGAGGASGLGGDADAGSVGGVVSLAADLVCPEMPPSWVPKLQVASDAFDMRCPKGSKGVVYLRALHEVFAMFGECSRWDGMVSRLTRYSDDARGSVCEVREHYSRRKDRLVKRVSFPLEDRVLEYFDPGAHYGLKELCTISGKRRIAYFYPKSRLDGLVSRHEEIGKKTVEVFQDRDDRMVYRSVTYDPEPPPRPPSPQAAAPGLGPGATAKEREAAEAAERERRRRQKKVETLAVIRKMTEKFSRDPSGALPAARDVAMRRYYVASDSIRIDFHYEEERISFNSRTYTKEGLASLTMADPLEPRPGDAALVEENQRLLLAEKECANAVREMERESRDMVASRNKEEQAIQLITPYYDVVRVKQEEADDEGNGDEVKQEHDYLMAFLPTAVPGVADASGKPPVAADGKAVLHLSRAEAMEVRDRCLKALKDRLIERANIIQARHDEETMALAKRQANFARDRDQMSRAEEEEYEKACEESMFRIHILEQRLKRHEEQALHKYYELDNRLRRDPRLASLLDGPA